MSTQKFRKPRRKRRLMFLDTELIRQQMIAFRKMHKLNITEFAAKTGLSLNILSRMERKKTKWTLDKIDKVVIAFNLSRDDVINYFLKEPGKKQGRENVLLQYIMSSINTFLKNQDLETLENIKTLCQRYMEVSQQKGFLVTDQIAASLDQNPALSDSTTSKEDPLP